MLDNESRCIRIFGLHMDPRNMNDDSKAELFDKIKAQGELIRKLKSEKEDPEKVCISVIVIIYIFLHESLNLLFYKNKMTFCNYITFFLIIIFWSLPNL